MLINHSRDGFSKSYFQQANNIFTDFWAMQCNRKLDIHGKFYENLTVLKMSFELLPFLIRSAFAHTQNCLKNQAPDYNRLMKNK